MSPNTKSRAPGGGPTNPLFAYVLDEISLVTFLWRAALGREIAVLAIRPIFPQLRSRLDRIARWAIERYCVKWTIEYTPDLIKDWRWDRNLYFRNVYGQYESWQDDYFGIPRPNGETDDFAYAFNHVTANYVYDKAIEIYALNALEQAAAERRVIKVGMTKDTAQLYTHHFGDTLQNLRMRRRIWDFFFNCLICGLAILTTTLWMVKRVRLRRKPQNVFCIVDRLGNDQEKLLIEALEDGGKIISFDRSSVGVSGECIRWGEGWLSPTDLLGRIPRYIGQVAILWWRHGWLSSRHFYIAINLPRKAVLWRALFNIYRPKHFIGRDEYNSDHIIRGGELARIGAISHGISGAVYLAYTDFAPNSRYVGFDHHYVIGLNVVIADRWRKSMALHPIGTWGFPAARLQQSGAPGDAILISVRIAFEEEEMVRITHAVARAFPDKAVILQMKPVTFLSDKQLECLIRRYKADLPNVSLSNEPIYDLVEKARYHISDISSIVAESIHRGAFCYVADVLGHRTCCYRDFPELCVSSAADAVSRIERIERGEVDYPRDDYMRRLGLPLNTNPFNVIRANMGLSPG